MANELIKEVFGIERGQLVKVQADIEGNDLARKGILVCSV